MRILNTRVHALLDYLIGITLMALPWLLEFERGGAETITLVTAGTVLILYSLATDYELGIARFIPMVLHLAMDTVLGTFLAASPWMLGFASVAVAPHTGFGLLLITAALFTRATRPQAAPTAW